MENKLDNLQYVRAIAAIFVVLDHTFATSYVGVINDSLYQKVHYFFNLMGAVGVAVFFSLSGFLMTYTMSKRKTPYSFLLSRIKRIYPPYLLFSIPIIIYAIVSKRYDHGIENITQLIQNLLLIPGTSKYDYTNANYPAWTLVYEMFFYFIFSLMIFISKEKGKIALAISIFFLFLVFVSTKLGGHGFNSTSVNITHIVSNPLLLNFAVGSLIGSYARKIKNLPFKLDPLVIIIALMLIEILVNLIGRSNFTISVLISLSIPSLIIYLCIAIENKHYKKLLFIGNASYSIYLSHVTILFFRGKVQSLIPYRDYFSVTLINIMFVFLCVIVGLILYKLIEEKINNFFTKKLYLKSPIYSK